MKYCAYFVKAFEKIFLIIDTTFYCNRTFIHTSHKAFSVYTHYFEKFLLKKKYYDYII